MNEAKYDLTLVTEAHKDLLRRFTQCWNQANLALIEEFIAPDFIHHDPDRPDVGNREDYQRWFAQSHSLFPDLHLTVEDLVAEADRVVARWTFRGTNSGDFETPSPLPATGKQVSGLGINIYRIAGRGDGDSAHRHHPSERPHQCNDSCRRSASREL